MVTVSIIILSYNTKDLLARCLESLFKNVREVSHEVIVVDNNSSDGSADFVKKQFKKVTVIENTENVGFAKGINSGAEHAKGTYLLFLNSDTEMVDSSLSELVTYLDQHQDAGVVGGLLTNIDGTVQRSYGSFYHLPSVILMIFGGEKLEIAAHSHSKIQEVDWVSGGFFLTRAHLFNELSGFDEHFFMYIEDMEFCYRVKKAGYKVVFAPFSRVLHVGHASASRSFAIVQIYKGLLYFYKKHKNILEYNILKVILAKKALIAIGAGYLLRRPQLVCTYKKALRVL